MWTLRFVAKAKDYWRHSRAVAALRAVETREGLLLLRRVIGSGVGLIDGGLFGMGDGFMSAIGSGGASGVFAVS